MTNEERDRLRHAILQAFDDLDATFQKLAKVVQSVAEDEAHRKELYKHYQTPLRKLYRALSDIADHEVPSPEYDQRQLAAAKKELIEYASQSDSHPNQIAYRVNALKWQQKEANRHAKRRKLLRMVHPIDFDQMDDL